GFWVVLGTLSVLRSNATSTGVTALQAMGGVFVGFVIGALVILGIGDSDIPGLWIALVVAVAIATYAPGAAPLWVGQAGVTVVVAVVCNLMTPAGWGVVVYRVQDVAMGAVVSIVVGLVFWPRGAGRLVREDLADALRAGTAYLAQSVDWALGL